LTIIVSQSWVWKSLITHISPSIPCFRRSYVFASLRGGLSEYCALSLCKFFIKAVSKFGMEMKGKKINLSKIHALNFFHVSDGPV